MVLHRLLDFFNKLLYAVRYWNKFPSTMLKILWMPLSLWYGSMFGYVEYQYTWCYICATFWPSKLDDILYLDRKYSILYLTRCELRKVAVQSSECNIVIPTSSWEREWFSRPHIGNIMGTFQNIFKLSCAGHKYSRLLQIGGEKPLEMNRLKGGLYSDLRVSNIQV